jgi:hypothetical protein
MLPRLIDTKLKRTCNWFQMANIHQCASVTANWMPVWVSHAPYKRNLETNIKFMASDSRREVGEGKRGIFFCPFNRRLNEDEISCSYFL